MTAGSPRWDSGSRPCREWLDVMAWDGCRPSNDSAARKLTPSPHERIGPALPSAARDAGMRGSQRRDVRRRAPSRERINEKPALEWAVVDDPISVRGAAHRAANGGRGGQDRECVSAHSAQRARHLGAQLGARLEPLAIRRVGHHETGRVQRAQVAQVASTDPARDAASGGRGQAFRIMRWRIPARSQPTNRRSGRACLSGAQLAAATNRP